jgi:hypothetical protein
MAPSLPERCWLEGVGRMQRAKELGEKQRDVEIKENQ